MSSVVTNKIICNSYIKLTGVPKEKVSNRAGLAPNSIGILVLNLPPDVMRT